VVGVILAICVLLAAVCVGTGLVELGVCMCALVLLAVPVCAYLAFEGIIVTSLDCDSLKQDEVQKAHIFAARSEKALLRQPISNANCAAAAAKLAASFTSILTAAATEEGETALPADQSAVRCPLLWPPSLPAEAIAALRLERSCPRARGRHLPPSAVPPPAVSSTPPTPSPAIW